MAPVPEKKKITLDKNNCLKALKLQQTAASPDLDENGECLDYDDFEPGDDPDNIQIDYQMLAPSPVTRIPPLEDAPMSMLPATTQSQVSTGPVLSRVPWSTPSQRPTEPPALAGDCQCKEHRQYNWDCRRIQYRQCK